MKKLFYPFVLLLAASVIFTGCRTDDPEPPPTEYIVVTDGEINQTVFANETEGRSTVEFTTRASWESSIKEDETTTQSTRDASELWASISPSSGVAGNHEIAITLEPNTTGADRTIIITITSGNGTITICITQQAVREDDTIPVANVTLNESALELTVGETETLLATVTPDNATNQAVTWSTSDAAVADIDDNGVVTAVSVCTAIITVTTIDGAHTATAEVTILLPPNQTDEGVVIGGIRWATRNVDMPGTFTANPEDAGMLFPWNRRIGWSSTDPMVNSDGGTTWDGLSPAGTAWHPENDPCPIGWRVPTQAELQSLVDVGSVWTERNGVNGRLFGVVPNQLFLPAAKFRVNPTGELSSGLGDVGNIGCYWSSTPSSWQAAWGLQFSNSHANVSSNAFRIWAMSVRCVAE